MSVRQSSVLLKFNTAGAISFANDALLLIPKKKNSSNSCFLFFLKCWKEISILVMTQPVIENGREAPFSMTGWVMTKIDVSFQHFRKNKKRES